jgi:hypothetical protein
MCAGIIKKVVLAVQRTPPRPMQDEVASYTTAKAAPVYYYNVCARIRQVLRYKKWLC